jgi:hypothetical protein
MKLKDAKVGDIIWFAGADYIVQEDCKVILYVGFIDSKPLPKCENEVIYKKTLKDESC